MRRCFFFLILLLVLPSVVRAQETPTDTPTPTETPTPAATVAATEEITLTPTSSPTPTPDLYWVFQLPSGKSGAITYQASTGEIVLIGLLIALLMSIWFGLFLLLRQQR